MATLVELERDLAAARLACQELLDTDVKAFNELALVQFVPVPTS